MTCSQVAYYYSFKNSFATSQISSWKKIINSTIEGNPKLASINPLSTSYLGNQECVEYIEHMHPNYIRERFRDAQNVKGSKSSYEELIVTMNQKSFIPSETRWTLLLHRLKLYQWFIDNSGKEVPPKEKSLDTPDHKTRRKRWVKEWYTLLIDRGGVP